MIISRWKGFEIDSSEGYYIFEEDLKKVEEGWEFLTELLYSPLLWNKVAFELSSVEAHKQHVVDRLSYLLKKGLIEETEEKYDYCFFVYAASIPSFLDILKDLKEFLVLIYFNFCIAPLKSLPKDEYKKLRTWFVQQFDDEKEGESRWRDYRKIKEKDFHLSGNSEMTDEWMDVYAFEGNFQFQLEEPGNYSLSISAGDPSLVVYLISTLVEKYELEFVGDHEISIDRRPDKLAELLD